MRADIEHIRQALSYDPATGEMRWSAVSKYHSSRNGRAAGHIGTANGKQYHIISLDGRAYKRSRLAFTIMVGRWPAHCVDHINGDSLDDRWANLREATSTQNAWNHHRRAKRSALPMGVRVNPSGRFSARIAVHKRMVQIGTFDTVADAAAAYQSARELYYGEFA